MASAPVPISRITVCDRNHPPQSDADYSDGAIFLIDKPTDWSSFDVVKFMRSRIRVKKTGHAGTLDPLATGLLVLCAGKATKSISLIQDYPKRYVADVRFGASTPSQDAATKPDAEAAYDHITLSKIKEVLATRFTGKIMQTPPMYSALWKDGKRLYTYARKGEVVEREPREVEIFSAGVVSYTGNRIVLDVTCSKGTYIRTLAHDLGIALGSLAHLDGLRRTGIGPFTVDNALTIEQVREVFNK